MQGAITPIYPKVANGRYLPESISKVAIPTV